MHCPSGGQRNGTWPGVQPTWCHRCTTRRSTFGAAQKCRTVITFHVQAVGGPLQDECAFVAEITPRRAKHLSKAKWICHEDSPVRDARPPWLAVAQPPRWDRQDASSWEEEARLCLVWLDDRGNDSRPAMGRRRVVWHARVRSPGGGGHDADLAIVNRTPRACDRTTSDDVLFVDRASPMPPLTKVGAVTPT
jgi:hypothetical protein